MRATHMELLALHERNEASLQSYVNSPAALGSAITKLHEVGAHVGIGNANQHAMVAQEVALLAHAGAAQAHALVGRGGLPMPDDFLRALPASPFGDGERLSLAAFGRALATIMYDGAPFRTFLGPLDVEPPERRAAAGAARGGAGAVVRDAFATKQVAEVADHMEVAEARNAVRSSELFRYVGAVLDGKDGGPPLARSVACDDGRTRRVIDMVCTLFDPWSYSQTVENLFYFSFLVKEKMAGVYLDPTTGTPLITLIRDDSEEEEGMGLGLGPTAGSPARAAHPRAAAAAAGRDATALRITARQFVVQIDMQSWEALIKARGLTAPRMPHRRSRDDQAPPGARYTEDAARPAAGVKRKVDPLGASIGGGGGAAARGVAAASPSKRGRGTE